MSIDVPNLQEIIKLTEYHGRVKEIVDQAKKHDKEIIEDKMQSLDSHIKREYFWFNSVDSKEKEIPHNYYAYLADLIRKEFNNCALKIDRLLASISSKTEVLEERKKRVYSRLTSQRIEESFKVSNKIFEKLKLSTQPKSPSIAERSGVIYINSLEDLDSLIERRLSDLQVSIRGIEESCEIFARINDEEQAYHSILEIGEDKLRSAKAKFDLIDFEDAKNSIEELLEQVKAQHVILAKGIKDVSPKELTNIKNTLTRLREDIGDIDRLIVEELWVPFSKERQGFIIRVNKLIDACSALSEIPKDMNAKREALNQMNQNESTMKEFLISSYKCSEVMNLISDISSSAKEILKTQLDDLELAIFNAVVELYDMPEAEQGIELDKLEAKIDNLSRLDLMTHLISLWEKGVLSIRAFI